MACKHNTPASRKLTYFFFFNLGQVQNLTQKTREMLWPPLSARSTMLPSIPSTTFAWLVYEPNKDTVKRTVITEAQCALLSNPSTLLSDADCTKSCFAERREDVNLTIVQSPVNATTCSLKLLLSHPRPTMQGLEAVLSELSVSPSP